MLVAGTFFMEILDGTIISTAAPDIARSLGVRSADVGVAITAYLVALAVLIPVSGWIADRYGTRTVFVAAIGVFCLASGLCALCTSLTALAAVRVVQGAGGAMMVPVGRLVVLRGTAKADLIRAIAFLTWPGLVAPIVAPLAGGLITTYLTWQWIFLINLPLGALAAGAALRVVPQLRDQERRPIDGVGFIQTSGCLAATVLALSALGGRPTPWSLVAVTGVVAAALGATSSRHLLRAAHPLLEVRLLSIASFRIAHASGGVYRATVFAIPFVVPLMLQDAFGWTPVKAGVLVMAIFVGNLAIKPSTTWMLTHLGFRTVIAAAVSVVGVTMLALALITAGTPVLGLAALLVVSGAARSVGFTAYNTLAFADVDQARMTAANTLSATLQQLAGGLGVAVGALGLQLGESLGTGTATSAVPYRLTFVALGVLTLACLGGVARAGPDLGDQLRPAPAVTGDRPDM